MQIPINTDLRKFKAKDIGNFTFKEAGFLVAGLIIGGGIFFLQSQGEGEINIPLCIIPAIIVILFGFLKPFGMEMKDFMGTIFLEMFLYPKVLKWDSDYVHEEDEAKKLFGDEYDYVYFGIDDNDTSSKKKPQKKKK